MHEAATIYEYMLKQKQPTTSFYTWSVLIKDEIKYNIKIVEI